MTNTNPTIKCRRCGHIFEPDMKTKETWPCPSCQAKNPNLKRHYRSVADLCILGFIITAIVVSIAFSKAQFSLGVMLSVAHGVLLLVTIVFVYKSKTPWSDRIAKNLIWTVFGLALLFNVIVPLLAGKLNIPAIVVYALVFPYLFWLNSQTSNCMVSGPQELPSNKES